MSRLTVLLQTTAQIYHLLCCTGLSIVSPPWLLRSLAQGTPDRCLHMSLDASRHLPPSVQHRQAQGSSLTPSADGVAFPQDLTDRQARQTFVQQLQDQEVHQQWGKSTAPDCRLDTVPASVCAAVLCSCSSFHPFPVAAPIFTSLAGHHQHVHMCICVREPNVCHHHIYIFVCICVQGLVLCWVRELAGRLTLLLSLSITETSGFAVCAPSEAYSAGMQILHMVGVSQGWRNKHYRRLRPCWMR